MYVRRDRLYKRKYSTLSQLDINYNLWHQNEACGWAMGMAKRIRNVSKSFMPNSYPIDRYAQPYDFFLSKFWKIYNSMLNQVKPQNKVAFDSSNYKLYTEIQQNLYFIRLFFSKIYFSQYKTLEIIWYNPKYNTLYLFYLYLQHL